jgi:hypothetical protein
MVREKSPLPSHAILLRAGRCGELRTREHDARVATISDAAGAPLSAHGQLAIAAGEPVRRSNRQAGPDSPRVPRGAPGLAGGTLMGGLPPAAGESRPRHLVSDGYTPASQFCETEFMYQ